MSTPTPKFLQDARTGVIYEERASRDGFIWAQRIDDGTLETFASGYLVAYEPRPSKGEVWKVIATGEHVITVGRFDGQWYTVPFMAEDGPPTAMTLPLTPYRNRDLTPIVKRARRRDDVIVPTPEAVTPPA